MAPPKYPGPADLSEAQRLKAQNELIAYAFGGPLSSCPIDRHQSNLRILDASTADGFFLHQIRPLFTHADNAEFVGTDIAIYKDDERSFTKPANMHFHRQDMNDEWPKEWESSFDLVSQRCAVANNGTFRRAVQNTAKLLKLVKPGGYVFLVDGYMPSGQFTDAEPARDQFFRTIGNLTDEAGLDTSLGTRLPEIMEVAAHKTEGVELEDVKCRIGQARLGFGAPEETAEAGWVEIHSLSAALRTVIEKRAGKPLGPVKSVEQWDEICEAMLKECKTKGVEMVWFVAWGRRKA